VGGALSTSIYRGLGYNGLAILFLHTHDVVRLGFTSAICREEERVPRVGAGFGLG
jgi:hypothetical protein